MLSKVAAARHRVMARNRPARLTGAMDMHAMNQQVIEQFRAGEPMRMAKERTLLLTTRGRCTGREQVTPMMFTRVDGEIVVVASHSGAATDPDWFRNAIAEPSVRVKMADETFEATAEVVGDAERAAAWSAVIEQISMYAEHQAGTERAIPLARLRR